MQKPFEVSIIIPIYGSKIFLNVSNDLKKAVKANPYLAESYGDEGAEKEEWYGALHLRDLKGNFGIFYEFDNLTRGVIAHEIFHLTHYIIDHVGDHFDIDNHEVFAYLNHWLTDWVYMHLMNRKVYLAVHTDTDVILRPTPKQRKRKRQPNKKHD